MKTWMRRGCAAIATIATVPLFTGAAAGAYTASQAEEGQQAYQRFCADCHHVTLRGSGHGPPLTGPTFRERWQHRPAAELIDYIRTKMSATLPPSAGSELHAALAARILQANGARSSGAVLEPGSRLAIGSVLPAAASRPAASVADDDARAAKHGRAQDGEAGEDRQAWEGAAGIAERAETAGKWSNRETPPLTPVTDELLRNPPPSDWLSWRRTLDGQGYSPLKQIDRGNVKKLRLAWALTMRDGSNQVTPLVHDGVMFLTHPVNAVQALDAATGELIWEYAYSYPPDARALGGPTRNIAIYGDKLFLTTYDAALVALDVRTGRQLWRTVKADYRKGYTHSAGPIIAGGAVVSGINGCEWFHADGCFVTAHDPDTGRELWRTFTIARPGDPNDSTWGGVPPALRGGGDTWIAGSYDPELNLYYVGVSQAKPWVAASRGMSARDAALYTNSTLALDPKTGQIKWHFQHTAGETLDMETAFERILVDLDGEKLLLTIGKDGILWKLDRRDGRFLGFRETVYQNLYERLDHETGRTIYRRDILEAGIGDWVAACPSIYGGHNWQAAAYSPESRSVIIPLHQLCMEFVGREVSMTEGGGGYGGESKLLPMPGTDGRLGRLSAFDVGSLSQRWTHTQRAMFLTGVLTTAGKLAFVGDLDRYFKAFDVETGKVLWQTRLAAPLHGFPISYEAGGRQYLAVAVGMGVFRLMTARQSPDIYQPSGGNALYVFELAD